MSSVVKMGFFSLVFAEVLKAEKKATENPHFRVSAAVSRAGLAGTLPGGYLGDGPKGGMT